MSCDKQKVLNAIEIKFWFVLPMPSKKANQQSNRILCWSNSFHTSNAPASSRNILPACLRPFAITDLAADILVELQRLERKDNNLVQQTIGVL